MTAPRALLRGDRVLLRHPSLRDREEFLTRVRASKKLHAKWTFPPGSREEFDAYVKRARTKTSEALLVCRSDDGAIAGVYNISQIFHGPLRSAYLGYYAFEPFAGRGYMKEGMRLALRRAVARPRALGDHRRGPPHPASKA